MAVPEDIELAEPGTSEEPSLPPDIVQPPKEDDDWDSFKKQVLQSVINNVKLWVQILLLFDLFF